MKSNLYKVTSTDHGPSLIAAPTKAGAENVFVAEMLFGTFDTDLGQIDTTLLGEFDFDLQLDVDGEPEARFLTSAEREELRRREAAGDFIVKNGQVVGTV